MTPEQLMLQIVQQKVCDSFPQSVLKIIRHGFIFTWSRIVCDVIHNDQKIRVTVKNQIYRAPTTGIAQKIIEEVKREINVP